MADDKSGGKPKLYAANVERWCGTVCGPRERAAGSGILRFVSGEEYGGHQKGTTEDEVEHVILDLPRMSRLSANDQSKGTVCGQVVIQQWPPDRLGSSSISMATVSQLGKTTATRKGRTLAVSHM